jgi:tetraacyldisaccharide 4'-kinase
VIRPANEQPIRPGDKVAAFAGIGRPEKFFETLRASGAVLAASQSFPDHHAFTEAELTDFADSAPPDAMLVTTEKDYVRLPPAWRDRVHAVPVVLCFEDPTAIHRFLTGGLTRC